MVATVLSEVGTTHTYETTNEIQRRYPEPLAPKLFPVREYPLQTVRIVIRLKDTHQTVAHSYLGKEFKNVSFSRTYTTVKIPYFTIGYALDDREVQTEGNRLGLESIESVRGETARELMDRDYEVAMFYTNSTAFEGYTPVGLAGWTTDTPANLKAYTYTTLVKGITSTTNSSDTSLEYDQAAVGAAASQVGLKDFMTHILNIYSVNNVLGGTYIHVMTGAVAFQLGIPDANGITHWDKIRALATSLGNCTHRFYVTPYLLGTTAETRNTGVWICYLEEQARPHIKTVGGAEFWQIRDEWNALYEFRMRRNGAFGVDNPNFLSIMTAIYTTAA